MPVDAAARRHRGAGAAVADGRTSTPLNAEVEGAQRSACARADEPRCGARGATGSEGLPQAVAGENAMADGASR